MTFRWSVLRMICGSRLLPRVGIEEGLIVGRNTRRRKGFGNGMISAQPGMQGYDFHGMSPAD
jgi:hypothetical protein